MAVERLAQVLEPSRRQDGCQSVTDSLLSHDPGEQRVVPHLAVAELLQVLRHALLRLVHSVALRLDHLVLHALARLHEEARLGVK